MESKVPHFSWYELATPDFNASIAFYSAVIGWTAEHTTLSDSPYAVLSASGTPVAGISGTDGFAPSWTGSIRVENIDDSLKKAQNAGAKVIYGPHEVPDMVRYAVLTDPQGVVFSIHQELATEKECDAAPGKHGTFGWSELHADAMEPEFKFYAALFGWTKSEDLEMDEIGTYRIFAIDGQPVGGMMNRTKNCPSAYWQFYINVDDLDATIERVKNNKGQIMYGPQEVPGGARIVIGKDPQGILFALLQPPAVAMKK